MRNTFPISFDKWIYNLVSLSFSFAVIITIGYIFLMPTEVGIIQYNHEIFWVFFITYFFIVGGFMFFILLKPFVHHFLEIFEISAGIFAGILLISYINFDLNEPWIMQSAYFLRSAGIEFGFLFGFLILKSAINMSVLTKLIKKNNSLRVEREHDSHDREFNENSKQNIILTSVLILTMGFVIFLFYLYRNISIFSLFGTITLIQTIFSIYSSINLRKKQLNEVFRLFSIKIPHLNGEKSLKGIKKFKFRFNTIANFMGSDPSPFWRLWKAFLAGFIFNIIGAIFYFTGSFFNPYNPIPLSEIFSAVYVILMILQFVFMIIKDNTSERYNIDINNSKLVPFFKLSTIISKFIKFIGLFFIVVFLIYFHDYPIFFPEILIQNSTFIIIGIVAYFITTKLLKRFSNESITKTSQFLLTLVGIITLYFALELLFEDGWIIGFVNNGYRTYEYYTYFPYDFLHSINYSIMVGIPIGIILANIFQDIFITYAKPAQGHFKIIGISLIIFSICAGTIPLNLLLNNPGTATIPFEELFNYICFVIKLGILGFGAASIWEFGLSGFYKNLLKKRDKTINVPERTKPTGSLQKNKLEDILSGLILTKNQRKASLIASIMLCNIFIIVFSIGIPVSYSTSYSPTMVSYSSNEYAIWPVDSAERISDEIQLNKIKDYNTKPAELSLARNEYGALQFVWNTLGTKTFLKNYTISNFVHLNSSSMIINSTNCELRKERYYLYGEFPEILEPINTTSHDGLLLHDLNVFWFNIRTPYEAEPGVYNGTIQMGLEVNSVSKIINLDININVWNFTVPNQRHIRTELGYDITITDPIYDHFVDHRLNPRGFPMICSWNGSEWLFDWNQFDTNMLTGLEAGFNAFNIKGGPEVPRSPDVNDTVYLNSLQSYLSTIQTHCESKYYRGVPWTEFLFWYFIDEYTLFLPSEYENFEDYFADLAIIMSKMKEAAPDIKIMTTGSAEEANEILKPYISIYCPVSPDYDKEVWDQYISEGKEFWMYTCVQPLAPMPNYNLYNRLFEIRVLNWQLWDYGCVGYLGWGAVSPKHGGGGVGHNGWGDGWFIYYVEEEVYESVRWENFLDGQEDYEYLWLLNASIYEAEINGTISETKANELKHSMREIVGYVTGELWEYTDHPNDVYENRAKIASMLEDMAEIIDLEIIGERMWIP